MKKSIIFEKIIELKRKFIAELKPENLKNHDGKSFTRNRNLTLKRMMSILLQGITKPLQLQVDDYFEQISSKEEIVSKQAFSKSRANLDPDVVKEVFLLTTKTICSCDDHLLYKDKFRICAIDGSDIALDNSAQLKAHFGCSGSKVNAATALASVCYDPLNNVILDAELYPYGTSERDAARAHINALQNLPNSQKCKNLYIFDRGYPSKKFFAELINANHYFLMRVRKKFNVDFDLVQKKEKITFSFENKEYCVRVFKIMLKSGETEILVTNVHGKYLKRKEIGDLYFTRWGIETKFNSLKNKLELENMSGRRPVTVYQDFWAKLDLANTMAALEFATNESIKEKSDNKTRKYPNTTNENRFISNFSKRYADLLNEPDPAKRLLLFDILVADIAMRPEDVKLNRSFKRKIPRKMKFCDRIKRVLR